MTRKIKFEGWKNPLGGGEEYAEGYRQGMSPVSVGGGGEADDPDWEDVAVRPVVPMPMGYMPLKPYGDMFSNFNFYMANTTFRISPEMLRATGAVPGVESTDPLSDYRFRFGVAKLFRPEAVQDDIAALFGVVTVDHEVLNPRGTELTPTQVKKVTKKLRQMADRHDKWAVYLMQNGEFAESQGEALDVEMFREAQEIAGGIVFAHEGYRLSDSE